MEQVKLPINVASRVDVARLLRELNSLNDFFTANKVRATGTSMRLPKLSSLLDQLAKDNQVNLLDEASRDKLAADLDAVYQRAPKLHISFATDPSPKAFESILVWLRQNIHPQVLVEIGLQPGIAAGCILRTSNRLFDMSLRANLSRQESYLTKLIAGAVDGR